MPTHASDQKDRHDAQRSAPTERAASDHPADNPADDPAGTPLERPGGSHPGGSPGHKTGGAGDPSTGGQSGAAQPRGDEPQSH